MRLFGLAMALGISVWGCREPSPTNDASPVTEVWSADASPLNEPDADAKTSSDAGTRDVSEQGTQGYDAAPELVPPAACRAWDVGPVTPMRPAEAGTAGVMALAAAASSVGSWVLIERAETGNGLWIDRYDETGSPSLPEPYSNLLQLDPGGRPTEPRYGQRFTWLRATSEIVFAGLYHFWLWPGRGNGRSVSFQAPMLCCDAFNLLPDEEIGGVSFFQPGPVLRRFRADGTEFERRNLSAVVRQPTDLRVLTDDGGFAVLLDSENRVGGRVLYAHYDRTGTLLDPVVPIPGAVGGVRAAVSIPSGVMFFWDESRQPLRGQVIRNDGVLVGSPFALTAAPSFVFEFVAAVAVGGEVLVALTPNERETEVQRRSFRGELIGTPVRLPIASRMPYPKPLLFTATAAGALLFAPDGSRRAAQVVAFTCVR
jgi:hypothetical protein